MCNYLVFFLPSILFLTKDSYRLYILCPNVVSEPKMRSEMDILLVFIHMKNKTSGRRAARPDEEYDFIFYSGINSLVGFALRR